MTKEEKREYDKKRRAASAKYYAANKEKIAERGAKYRAANKEKIAERKAKYQAANKEKIAEHMAKYQAANKEKIAERKAKYQAANKEKIAERKAKYYAANREKFAEHMAKYYAANREKFAEHNRTPKRRWSSLNSAAKRRGLSVEITYEQWLALIEPNECYYCEGPLPETGYGIDRIDSSKGYVAGNCVPCCTTCNKMLLDHSNEDAFKHMEKMISVKEKRIVAKNANK